MNKYDITSLWLIIFIVLLSLIRFDYFPQYTDAYYHLSCANGFKESGGWFGWSWWEYAPQGRPHIYPPVYHFILVFLQKIGLSGLYSVKITELISPSLFFLIIWLISKSLVSSLFAFFNVLILSSFFSFYASASANIPANLAVIFGLFSWYFLKKKKIISSSLFLILSFYTHTGIPWVFFISILFCALLKDYNKVSLKTALLGLLGAAPLIIHQLRYINYLNLSYWDYNVSREIYNFLQINVFLFSGLIFLFFMKKKEFNMLLFAGYFAASFLIFFKYPYRLISAQGIVGLCFLSSLYLADYFDDLRKLPKKIIFLFLCIYLVFVQSTINFQNKKINFKLLNSIYYHFLKGDIFELLEFKSIFYPEQFIPVIEIIKKETKPYEIVASNIGIIGQVFSSLSNRITSGGSLYEIKPSSQNHLSYDAAKIILWIKPEDNYLWEIKSKLAWSKIYENEILSVFLNHKAYRVSIPKAKISFMHISLFFIVFLCAIIMDNFGPRSKRLTEVDRC